MTWLRRTLAHCRAVARCTFVHAFQYGQIWGPRGFRRLRCRLCGKTGCSWCLFLHMHAVRRDGGVLS